MEHFSFIVLVFCMTQVTGDQNVPAGKVTLFTVDEPPTLGRYTGFEQAEDGAAEPRPIGAFSASLVCHRVKFLMC